MSLETPREGMLSGNSEPVIVSSENPVSPIPILLVPGYRGYADAYLAFMQEMSHRGHITVFPNYNFREKKKFGVVPDVNGAKEEALLAAIRQHGYPDERGVPKVDAIGHSLGGIDLALFVRDYPQHFRTVILLAPNGFHDEHGLSALRRLYRGEMANRRDNIALAGEDQSAADLISIGREASDARRISRLVTVFPEVRRGGFQVIHQLIPDIRAVGVNVVLAKMDRDSWFPPETYQQYEKMADDVISIPGYHSAIKYQPQVVANHLSELILSMPASDKGVL